MPTSCRRMFALKRSSTPKSRHSRRDAAVDRQNQNMELPITLPADHPLRLGNFTSAHLGTFESALTPFAEDFIESVGTFLSKFELSLKLREEIAANQSRIYDVEAPDGPVRILFHRTARSIAEPNPEYRARVIAET